jgi:threonine aldolase
LPYRVICEQNAHVYIYEGGVIASNSGAQVRAIAGNCGRINTDQVAAAVNPDDVHKAHSSLVCLENTSNRGGGSCYDFKEILKIREFCTGHNLRLHLDGARLFNALVAKNETPGQYGEIFDSISFCLNKGLGCPIGSLLLGSSEFTKKARRVRKVFGGGMRQAGFMAAAGIYALQHNIDRLSEDHLHAGRMADALAEKKFIRNMKPVETNIIIFEVSPPQTARGLTDELEKHHILAIPISAVQVRFVTHLGISGEMVEKTIRVIRQL